MIAIVNIDPRPRHTGEHLYSLRINRKELCQFYHRREDPLVLCLQKAAKAYAKQKREAYTELITSGDTK